MADLDSQLAAMGVTPIPQQLQTGLSALGVKPMGAPATATPDPGALESLLRGGEQQATLGFGDEINGGLEALLDSIKGSDKDFLSNYTKHRDESRAAMDAASTNHPTLYTVGGLAGGMIPALALGPMGLAGEGAAGALKAGAALGAVSGVGNSTDPNNMVRDGVVGGLLGGATGGAIGAAAEVAGDPLSKLLGIFKDKATGAGQVVGGMNAVSMPVQAFKQGLMGRAITGQVGKDMATNLAVDTVNPGAASSGLSGNIANILQTAGTAASAAKTALLKDRGVVSAEDMAPWLQGAEQAVSNAKDAIGSPGLDQVGNLIKKTFYDAVPTVDGETDYVPKDLKATQLAYFKTLLGNMGSAVGADGMTDPAAQALVNRLLSPLDETGRIGGTNTIEDALNLPDNLVALKTFMHDNIPGLAPLDSKISAVKGAMDLMPSMNSLLSSEKGGLGGVAGKAMVKNMLASLQKDPEIAQSVLPEVQSRLADAGQTLDLVNHANAPGLSHGWLADNARGAVMAAGNWTGLGLKSAADVGNMLYGASPESLQNVARQLSSSTMEGADQVSKILSEAAGRDRVGRNALIFAAQQNPAYRSVLQSILGSGSPQQ